MIFYVLIYLLFTYILVMKFHKKYESKELSLGITIMSILFPVGGIILVSILLRDRNLFFKTSSISYFESNQKEDNKTFFLANINVEEESDIVPLDETLLLSHLEVRRKTVLNILKRDSNRYTNFINRAVKNEDSETTHYAATSIMNTKRKLDADMVKIAKLYKEDSMNVITAISYSNLLEKQANIAYIDNEMKSATIKENISVLENIVNNRLSMSQDCIIKLIELLVDEKEFSLAIRYLNIFINNYSDTEEKYMTLLRSYYEIGDRDNFEKILLKIKEENIPLSKEAFNIVRFWLGGV